MKRSTIVISASALVIAVCIGALIAGTPAAKAPQVEEIQLKPCPMDDPMMACAYDHANASKLLSEALAGDYQAQRNVSYMHTAGTPWSVQQPVQGCGWRMVIMASRPADSTLDDAGMYRIQCGALDDADLTDAHALAQIIYKRIHGVDLPPIAPVQS